MTEEEKTENKSLRTHGFVLTIFLALQFLLGMSADLFVQFPEKKPAGQLWSFALKQWPVTAHIILAILIGIGALVLVIRSFRHKNMTWIIASVIGFAAVLAAAIAGSQFVTSQSDTLSFVMATSFIIALLSYGAGLFLSRG